MTLSIITINRNNAKGLEKTLKSVSSQSIRNFEHIIVDGASTDGSVEIIKEYAKSLGEKVKWISEPDKGVYNAMNKGIEIASGDYLQFLNSGDYLVSDTVLEKISNTIERENSPSILYGNMFRGGHNHSLKDNSFAGKEVTLLGFYRGTLNHPVSFIKKEMFDKYGKYDEGLRIVSDWKWFLISIILGGEKPVYTNTDVAVFDMTGISQTLGSISSKERETVLADLIPEPILADYKNLSFPFLQMERLVRHPVAYRIVWFIERCIFKIEKWHNRRLFLKG